MWKAGVLRGFDYEADFSFVDTTDGDRLRFTGIDRDPQFQYGLRIYKRAAFWQCYGHSVASFLCQPIESVTRELSGVSKQRATYHVAFRKTPEAALTHMVMHTNRIDFFADNYNSQDMTLVALFERNGLSFDAENVKQWRALLFFMVHGAKDIGK